MKERPPSTISGQPSEMTPEGSEKLKKSAETLFAYLRLEDEPQASDAIVILGGASLSPARKGAKLFEEGYASKIVFTGIGGTFGGDKLWGKPEHEVYRDTLRELNVPAEAIISEGSATNTLEEAKSTVPLLERYGVSPKKIILVTRPIHQRRAYATFQQQHPGITFLNCPSDESFDIDDLETRKRLIAEAERLLDYAKKADLQKQEIPREILRAAATVRVDLKRAGNYSFRKKPS